MTSREFDKSYRPNNAYRVTGFDAAKQREVFMRHIGIAPWVRIADAGEREHGYEITCWTLPNSRTLLFVCMNPETRGTSLGGGNSVGLKAATVPITLRFTRELRNVRDERTDRARGNGVEFALDWKQNEAVVLSFETR